MWPTGTTGIRIPRRLLLAGTAGVVAVLLVGLSVQVVRELQTLRQAPDDNTQFATFQLQNEFNRFYRAVLEAGSAGVADVRLRYDILFGRIRLIETAPSLAGIRDDPQLGSELAEFGADIKSFASTVDLPDAEVEAAVPMLHARLEEIEPKIYSFVQATVQHFAAAADSRRQAFSLLLYSVGGLTGTLVLGLLTALVLLLRQARQLVRREATLREIQQDLSRAQRIANVGSFRWNAQTDEFICSEEYLAILGLPPGTRMSRRQSHDLIHPDDGDRVRRQFAETLLRPRPGEVRHSQAEYRIVRRDGSVRHVRDVAEVEFDAAGRAAVAGTMRDITAEHEQQQAVAESEARLNVAQRLAHVGSFSWDVASGTVDWSDEAYRIYGIPIGTPMNIRQTIAYIHPDDRAILDRRTARIRESAPSATDRDTFEHRLVRPDGAVRLVLVTSQTTRDASGAPVRVAGSIQDVTERSAQQEELERARRAAEEASRAKGEFLAVMSHEIRTPLNGVFGMLTALDESGLGEQQSTLVNIARSSADALLLVLNDVLDMSKVEAGRLDLEPSPFELKALVQSVGHLYQAQAHAKGIGLAAEIAPGTPPMLVGDAGRLRQMMFNLVSNAIKFTNEGEVRVRATAAGTSARPGSVNLRVEVSDTGIGIPPEKQSDVFTRFNQLDKSYARRHGGTGLGLAITKSLAEMMEGHVGFESEVGKGTTFWFEVPLAVDTSTPASPEPAAALKAPVRSLKVLVAEDNSTNQMVARMMLERMGHRVEMANDGLEAVQMVQEHPFDLILMDVSMPVMDGLDATRRIRALGGAVASIPIFALTANAMDSDRAAFFEAGMQDIITKPLMRARLEAAIAGIVPMARPERSSDDDGGPAIDRGDLDRLAEAVGRDALPMLLAAFVSDIRKRRDEASAALAAGDREGIARAAHSLRGVSANFGARRLRALVEQIETDVREGRALQHEDVKQALESSIAEVLQASELLAAELTSTTAY